ncbi:hypothetical protein [Pantoea sp. V106_11]|uniref:hypothetical protein n=1 Tax=Pantoea sp. V106_11 TaxID=3044234 RepID=UPI00249D8DCC|nr:hypothetical protein [Pantoea sp. V106_11]MDI3414789.1 hypothetical protein [Pantoea sp. V106_11]
MPTRSNFSYALNVLWLLTEHDITKHQLNKGILTENIINGIKDIILESNCLDNYPEDIKSELINALFFIITKRIEEVSMVVKI